jgi:hypothetical protein
VESSVAPVAGHPFVALSLALFALDDADPVDGFCKGLCFASSVVTPWDNEKKRLPLDTLMPSHTLSHYLLVFFLMPEERERRESKNERENKGYDFLESICPGSNYFIHQVLPLPWWGQLVLNFLHLDSAYNQVAYLEGPG